MKLLLTTNGRLCKNSAGEYYTSVVYGYNFFSRYFEVFDDIYLVAHCETLEKIPDNYIRVDGKGLHILEVPFPHGKVQYIKKYFKVKKEIKKAVMNTDFDVAVLRIPDQLAFQVFNVLRKKKVPIGAEIISNSWDLFDSDISGSILRPFIRRIWDYNEKKICKKANGTSYVTKFAIQQRYKPTLGRQGYFTTNYSDVEIDSKPVSARVFESGEKNKTLLHVSADIGGTVKGHKELVESVAMLKNEGIAVNVVIVGDGTLSPEVRNIIDENRISSQIRLTGKLQKDELKKEYENSDIFVFPSYREGLPRVVIEAMSYGLPCIATELDGIKELLPDDCLVKVKDSIGLKEKIKSFVLDNKLLNEKSLENLNKSREYTKENLQAERNGFLLNLCELTNKGRKRKKILFFINTLDGGGAEKVLVDLVNTIDRSKYDITLLSLLGGINKKNLEPFVRYRQVIKSDSTVIKKLFMFLLQKAVPYAMFHKIFIGNNYDIEVAYLEGFPTRVIAKGKSSAAKISFMHTDCSKQNEALVLYKSKKEFLDEYKSFSKICFVSNVAMNGFEKAIGKLDNSIVIHNVLDIQKIKKLSHAGTSVSYSDDAIKLVTVGRLTQVKNYTSLVKICSELEKKYNFELFILGEGEQRAEIEKIISENGVKSVKLLGYNQNPYPYMKYADLYVCSSLAEGYSTAVTESIILGTPVLTTDCAGMDEILENGKYGMITENSYDGLKKGLEELLSGSGKLEKYTQAIAENSNALTGEKLLEAYYELFDEISNKTEEK